MPHADLRQCRWHGHWLIALVIWLAVVASAITKTSCQPVVGGGGEPNLSVPTIISCGKSYSNILRALRDNWESPITYLKKRGYLPKNSELLFANSDGDGNELLIQVEGDNRAELQNDCDAVSGRVAGVHTRDDNAADAVMGQELANAYKLPHETFSYIAEPQKGFLGAMKEKLMGLFGNAKKQHATTQPADATNVKLSPQKLNEQKIMAKLPSASAKTKQFNVPFSKDFKPTQHKYGYILDHDNAPHGERKLI